MREARAYNHSIYLMVAVPYTLFGIGAFTLYRACRKAKKAQESAKLSKTLEDAVTASDCSSLPRGMMTHGPCL